MRNSIHFFNATTMVILLLFVTGDTQAQVSWSSMGPGGGGWLSTITVVDDETNTVYVGCDVGGIYKSTDHGSTWEIKNSGLSMYYVQDIAYDPVVKSTLYAATRGGVFKSTNGANEWEIKRSGFPPESQYNFSAPISDIVIDPNHNNIVYAGVGVPRAGYELESFHWETAGVKGAIYKSTDFGENWTLIQGSGIDTSAMVYSLMLDPTNSNTIYAATSSGFYKSTDAAVTWAPKNSGLPHLLTMGMAIDPLNAQVLYTTLWAEPGLEVWQGGVYKSLDGGDSWVAKNQGLPQVVGEELGFTSNFPSLVMDGQNPQVLYVGNNPWTPDPGIYITTDGGENWNWVSRPDPPNQNMDMGWIVEHGPAVMCLAIDPIDTDRLFFGTSTHLFKTENAGGFWDQAYSNSSAGGYWSGGGLETTVVYDVAIDPTNSDNIYAGYWDMGFLKSHDGGESFKRTFEGMNHQSNTFAIIVDPAQPSTIYAATGWWETNEGEVCKSVDSGETWTVLNNGIPDAQVWSLALDTSSPPNSRTLYATSFENGVYKTTDGGQSWVPRHNGLGVEGNLQTRTITIDPQNPDVIFVGMEARVIESPDSYETILGGLYKSSDAAVSWNRVDSGLPQANVWDIEVDPENSQIIYTAVSEQYDHTQQVTQFGGVYKSTDGGISWINHTNGFGSVENLNVMSIAINPASSNVIYAVTSDDPFHDRSNGRGVFKSTDAGVNWTAINEGLGVLYFSSITIDPSNPSVLYAGSDGNGLMQGIDANLTGFQNDALPEGLLILPQNTPNPFNPNTFIQFTLPSSQNITLGIYNIEGRLVQTLLQGAYAEGSHSVDWRGLDQKGEQVASGVYFYRLLTDRGSLTKKMTLLK